MKIAYFILCHKDPDQVLRLIKRLDADDTLFVIHVDRRANIAFETIRALTAGMRNVHFAKRHRCYWGKFGIVQATLACISEGLHHSFDRAFLLSGQDYPIKSHQDIISFLGKYPRAEFIESFSLIEPNKWTTQTGMFGSNARARCIYLSVRGRTISPAIEWQLPLGLEPHGGSQWWCLTRAALEYVDRFTKAHPILRFHFSLKPIPDEMFFQTVLSNSPFKDDIEGSATFVDWSPPTPPYPKTLDIEDFDRLSADASKLFARKFDLSEESEALRERIDLELTRAKGLETVI